MTWWQYVGAAIGCTALLFYLDRLFEAMKKRKASR